MNLKKLYPEWWRKHFLLVELCLSVVAAACLLTWWKFAGGAGILNAIVHGSRSSIYGTLASIFGSLLGFVITSLSVVLGFSASDRLKIIRESTYYPQLWAVFTSNIRILAVTTVGWLTALFFDRDTKERPVLLAIALSFSLLGVLRLARCLWVLERIVEAVTAKPQPASK